MFEELLRIYLDIGNTDIGVFWSMTLPEILALLESYKRRRDREQQEEEVRMKHQIIIARNQALQITEGVACLFDKRRRQLTGLDEYYPSLFGNAVNSNDEADSEAYIEAYKLKFEAFASRHNSRFRHRVRKEGGGD